MKQASTYESLGAVGLPCLLLIDGHALAYRSFHAIRELKSPDGRPANGVFGFFKTLAMWMRRYRPTRMAVVWDGGLDKARLESLPSYKADRPPMPESLSEQIVAMQEGLEALGVASLQKEGVEADDWIAKLALQGQFEDGRVLIASSDKDFMQLVNAHVSMIKPGQEADSSFGTDEVLAKTGVFPGQIVDWLSLVGDSVDGIEGVPSVGPKTASDLLGTYQTIDGIFASLHQVKSERLQHLFREHEAVIRRNQRLIRLNADVEAEVAPEALRLANRALQPWRAFCSTWGFNSLARDFDALEAKQTELCFN